jgi:hypothetical protein
VRHKGLVRKFLLVVVDGPWLGPRSRWAMVPPKPLCRQPLKEILARASHLLTAKWFVTGGIEVTCNVVSTLVERTKDWIALLFYMDLYVKF